MENIGRMVLRLLPAQRLHGLIITIIFVIVALPVDIIAQSDTAWHWRRHEDDSTVRRTRAELDSLLRLHAAWREYSTQDKLLSLPDADLSLAGLAGAHLSRADFRGGRLWATDLQGTDLSGADLSGACLVGADLSGANLSGAALSGAALSGAELTDAHLWGAVLLDAKLSRTDLTRANLSYANLSGADLSDADLSGADLRSANLTGVCFEQIDSLPYIPFGIQTIGLRTLQYRDSPASLVNLREEFGKLGFRDQERQIICALRRHNAGILETIFFDWTSEYGSNLSRPWQIFMGIFVLCSAAYYIFMQKYWKSGVRVIVQIAYEPNDRSIQPFAVKYDESSSETTIFRRNRLIKERLIGYRKIPMSIRLIWWAIFFSGISAFNIGFRDVNFGRWLKLLTRTKFDLQPFGWVRVVSGFQALMSVYLIALWILSFSGTPFK